MDWGAAGVECPKCGTQNLASAQRCRICGNELRASDPKRTGPAKVCPFCRAENDPDAPFCSGCGKHLGSVVVAPERERLKEEKKYDRFYGEYPMSAKRTWRAGVGGTLIIMAAFYIIVDAALTISIGVYGTQQPEWDRLVRENPQLASFLANLTACESIRILFAVIAFAGGLFAIRRLRWGLAMTGGVMAILGMLSSFLTLLLGYFAFVASCLLGGAVIALVLVGLAKKEFMLS